MAVQIFRLRGVPDDEAEEVKALLDEHEVDYYETPAGNWGMSMPALWLKDESQEDQVRELIKVYQVERQQKARAEYLAAKQAGTHRKFIDEVKENPRRVILYLSIIAIILYFSTKPFVTFGQ